MVTLNILTASLAILLFTGGWFMFITKLKGPNFRNVFPIQVRNLPLVIHDVLLCLWVYNVPQN